jgi:acyl-CoA synthetase (AMP-forming)/AMP-acid ligase II
MSTLPVETFESYVETAPITGDGLLRRRAQQRPGVTALADPPNIDALGLGTPRAFTYRETDAVVDQLAALFIELGLIPGDTIAVQLPNLALSPLTLLGAWRAGLSVAMLPMLWREHEIRMACETVGPKALIGVAHWDGEPSAERLCDVAADQLSVRFVLGFGEALPDGVGCLDEVLAAGEPAPIPEQALDTPRGPAMISFTARAGLPLVPLIRSEEQLLAQGAMTVLALALDRRDVILNPYPLTGPAGLSLGLMPWLISGATLAQHHPFDYAAFVEQLLTGGATVTALPAPVLTKLAQEEVLRQPACRLRRLGAVWPTAEIAESPPAFDGAAALLFDLYPLGDLASVVLRREVRRVPQPIPIGPVRLEDDGGEAVFIETAFSAQHDREGYAELLLRGPLVAHAEAGPLAPDPDGFVDAGLRAAPGGDDRASLQIKGDAELRRHGGIALAVSELDQLYRSFPGFLDASCFMLPDPIIGDRVFVAVMPRPGEPSSLEELNRFLAARGVAPYKFPDKLLVVREIPRDADGHVLRDEILRRV